MSDTGLYEMWRMRFVLRIRQDPAARHGNDGQPSIVYSGAWESRSTRGFHDYQDEAARGGSRG